MNAPDIKIPFVENDAYGNMPDEIPGSYIPAALTPNDVESLRRNQNKLLARVIILEGKIK